MRPVIIRNLTKSVVGACGRTINPGKSISYSLAKIQNSRFYSEQLALLASRGMVAVTLEGTLLTVQQIEEMDAPLSSDLGQQDWQEHVISRSTTPPTPPIPDAARYLIIAPATAEWTGKQDQIAEWTGTMWAYTPPDEGMVVWVDAEDILYSYASGAWTLSPIPVHALVGGLHSASGLTVGQVLRATGATTFAFGTVAHSDLGGIGANDHHNQAHAINGADHTAAGLTTGHVMRATGATTFAFGQAQHSDLGGIGANDHHNQAHVLSGGDHTESGLTTGFVLQATGATTFGWGLVPVPVYDDTTRPAANTVSAGTMIFNTSDGANGAPNWSNGASWVDALGNLT